MVFVLYQPMQGDQPEGAIVATGPNFQDQWVRSFDDLDKAVEAFRKVAPGHHDVALLRW